MSQNISDPAIPADYYLGCDVAKLKLDVSFINANGQELWYDQLPNEELAIVEYLLMLCGAYPDNVIRCVVEATGTYHYALAETSHALGIPCQVYNPLITRSGIKNTIRGKKTDRSDALVIARLGLRGEGEPYVPEPYKLTKYYARSSQRLSALQSSFRQYHRHFTELMSRELTTETTELLHGIQTAIQDARKQIYRDLAASAQGDVFTRLQTITGIGPFVAASIIGEVQDVSRFRTSKQLIAYAGLDPKVRQSGKSLNATGRMSKRGSSYLRHSIFIAANVARQHDLQFRALYDKKRNEGKTYKEANCVVARKLLRVTRSVWLSGKDYAVPGAE